MSRRNEIRAAMTAQLADAVALDGVSVTDTLIARLDMDAHLPRVVVVANRESINRSIGVQERQLAISLVCAATAPKETVQEAVGVVAIAAEAALATVAIDRAEIWLDDVERVEFDLERARPVGAITLRVAVRYWL